MWVSLVLLWWLQPATAEPGNWDSHEGRRTKKPQMQSKQGRPQTNEHNCREPRITLEITT